MIPLRDNVPSSRTPYVNYLIIATCVIVFVAQKTVAGVEETYVFNPGYLVNGQAIAQLGLGFIILTVFTSMFMHANLLHIGMNMLFLWVFGDNVEDRMGHLRYLLFYLLCGVIAAATHTLVSLFSDVPVLGASGAIAGVLGAYFVLFRGAYVRTLVIFFFITVVDIPAFIFLLLWFVFQLFEGFGTIGGAGGGVAFWAHIGGFVAGWLLVRFFAVTRRGRPRPRVLDVRYD